jgi:hypothetical protein
VFQLMHRTPAGLAFDVVASSLLVLTILSIGCGPSARQLDDEPSATEPSPAEAAASDDLPGPDEDGDGVRDDVARYIDTNLQSPKARDAARRLARRLREELQAPLTEPATMTVVEHTFRAISCLHVFMNGDEASRLVLELRARVFDTPQRVKAHLARERFLHGKRFKWPGRLSEADCATDEASR